MLPDPEPGWGIDRAASPLAGLAGDVGRGSSRTRTAARRVSASTSARLNLRSRDGAEAPGCTPGGPRTLCRRGRSAVRAPSDATCLIELAICLASLVLASRGSTAECAEYTECAEQSARQIVRLLGHLGRERAPLRAARRPRYACFVQRKHCRLGAGAQMPHAAAGCTSRERGEDRALAVQGEARRRSRRFALRGRLPRSALCVPWSASEARCRDRGVHPLFCAERSSALLHASARVREEARCPQRGAGLAGPIARSSTASSPKTTQRMGVAFSLTLMVSECSACSACSAGTLERSPLCLPKVQGSFSAARSCQPTIRTRRTRIRGKLHAEI